MRLLHVSDWHLGRTTYNASRVVDHDKAIAEIDEIARKEKPDLIVHTGDLFEGIRPSYEDMDRGIRALRSLGEVAPTIVLCGNHDSPALFRLFNELLSDPSHLGRASGLSESGLANAAAGAVGASATASRSVRSAVRFVDRARPADMGGLMTFPSKRGDTIRLATLPFVHANRMVTDFENPQTWTVLYADRIQQIQLNLSDGLFDGANLTRDVTVFAAHLHVAGSTYSRSERAIHVTDAYASRIEHVPKVSYAAFGHIHKPQALPQNEKGWFAGSPIPLDFGEIGEQKYAILVEAEPGRPPDITPIPLSGGRALRRLQGSLADIQALSPTVGNALCLVEVTTETPVSDLSEKVRDLLPKATLLQVTESCAARKAAVLKRESAQVVEPTFEELFREYLAENGTKGATVDRVMATFSTLLSAVESEETATFAEEQLASEG